MQHNYASGYCYDYWFSDYCHARQDARKWARIALSLAAENLDWHESAMLAHEALSYAVLISPIPHKRTTP